MFDGKAFGEEMVAVVRAYVERTIEPLKAENVALAARNAALEGRLEALEARDVVGDLRPEIEAVARAVAALPGAPDLSGFATKDEVAEVRAAIPTLLPEPDLSGFATKDEVAEAVAALPEPKDFGPEIEAVRAAIPVMPEEPDMSGFATKAEVEEVRAVVLRLPEGPDLSDFATKDDVAEAVSAIVIPEAIKGEDADPEVAAEIVLGRIEERLSEIDQRVSTKLAEVKDGAPGKDGKLPVVKAWTDAVHYEGAIVTHRGALWQANADTGREPPHGDWTCLAERGEDGRSPVFLGTYKPEAEYRYFDAVARDGGTFVALRDNPGPCPGDGWQIMAMRGKAGPAIKGDPGPPGEPGRDAEEVAGLYRDGEAVVLTLVSGREFKA